MEDQQVNVTLGTPRKWPHNVGRYDLPGFLKIPRKHNTLWTSICGLITTLDILNNITIHAMPMVLRADTPVSFADTEMTRLLLIVIFG